MNERLWLPESSLADANKQERSLERKKHRIIKRIAPTVEIPASAKSSSSNDLKRQKKVTYSTIESGSYSKLSLYLALNDNSVNPGQIKASLLCGWNTDENDCVRNINSTVPRTFAEPQRSCPPSRLGTRAGKRADVYIFSHLDTSAYLQDYCTRCSYSAKVLARESSSTAHAIPEAKEEMNERENRTNEKEESNDRGYEKCLVKSHGGGRLEQLASRLGVKESLQDGQIRCRPRPTPPSFTRKTRVINDIIISASDRQTQQSQKQGESSSIPLLDQQVSMKSSGAGSSSTERPTTTELPSLTHQLPGKMTKTLFETKALRSNHQANLSRGLGEEESSFDVNSSNESLPLPTAREQSLKLEEEAKKKKGEKQSKFILGEDMELREKLLTRKAQALGLLTRDFSRARLVKKNITAETSRPFTQRQNTQYSNRACSKIEEELVRRPSTRTTDVKPSPEDDSKRFFNYRLHQLRRDEGEVRPPVTSHNKLLSEKLDKLQTIYKPQESISRQRTIDRRPVTRGGGGGETAGGKKLSSRPHTRLEKRLCRLLDEGSQYWNEIPRMGHFPISQHRARPAKQTESSSVTAEAHRTRKHPAPRSQVKYYHPRGALHDPSYHPSFELTGHEHRHRSRYQSQS